MGVNKRSVHALARQDFVDLAACFSPDARFRALVPRGLREASGMEEPAHYFQIWFGAADRVEVLHSSFEPMADRYHLAWRLRVFNVAGQRLVEQQAYATLRDDRFANFDLLCSQRGESSALGGASSWWALLSSFVRFELVESVRR